MIDICRYEQGNTLQSMLFYAVHLGKMNNVQVACTRSVPVKKLNAHK